MRKRTLIASLLSATVVLAGQDDRLWPATLRYDGATTVIDANSQSSRCLSAVLCTLASEFKIPLTFEDAPIESEKDLIDITSPLYVRKSLDDRLLIPRGGALSIALPGTASKNLQDPQMIIREILNNYAQLDYPGRYQVEHLHGTWNIQPTAYRGTDDSWKTDRPIMNTIIRLPATKTRNNADVLRRIFSEVLLQRGIKLYLGSLVSHNYLEAAFANDEKSGSALSLLNETFSTFGSHELWIVQCEPKEKVCALSIL